MAAASGCRVCVGFATASSTRPPNTCTPAGQVIAEKPTAHDFFDVMTRRYPDRLDPGTVWLNAQRLA